MIDGAAARKTGTVSEFGSKLDSFADFVFAAVCMIKLLPVMEIPWWMYVWIGMIALIKLINIIAGFAVRKRFASVHSVLNKATGALLFLLPLTLSFIELRISAIPVCIIASLAAVQEGDLIVR